MSTVNDIYTVSCSRCGRRIGVCPGSQPLPSIYCVDCEDDVREENGL